MKLNYIINLISEERLINQYDNCVVIFDNCQFPRCNFTFNGVDIDIYPAHLKSGESDTNEFRRCDQLMFILDDTKKSDYPIIIMDSNNNKLYEREYTNTKLSNMINNYGFKNVLDGQRGNE